MFQEQTNFEHQDHPSAYRQGPSDQTDSRFLTNGHRPYIRPCPPIQLVYPPVHLDTTRMSKQYFKFIQTIHHKEIIDQAIQTKSLPPGMTKQANKHTDFIKPSTPTELNKTKIHNNTMQ